MGAPFTIPEPATLDDVRRELEALLGGPRCTDIDTPDAIRRDLDALVARHRGAPTCRAAQRVPAEPNYPGNSGVAAEPDTAAEARQLHQRRQLHLAFDHGSALLDAIGLGPAALDEIDRAIGVLDALDAPDEDLEPWLADVSGATFALCGCALDAEDDSEEDEGTALESFGRGFVRSGPDDSEDSDPAERDDEHGSEDAEDIGHHASQYAPRPLTPAARAEVAALAAKAARMWEVRHAG